MGIRRIVKLTLQDEKCQEFEDKFSEIKTLIAEQPGCTDVKLLKAKGEQNVYFTLSEWESEELLDAYRKTPLFDEVWGVVKQWFDAKPEAWSTEIIIDNTEE